jgi:hypothetical protein
MVTLNADTTVTATFAAIPTYTLTVSENGTGSGIVTSSPAGIRCGSTCSHGYASGTQVTLSATAGSGSTFAGWSGACSGSGTCAVTMSGAKAVTATFDKASPPKGCVVPKVTGKRLRSAEHAIKIHNCRVGKIKYIFSTTVNKTHVISQKPAPHKRLTHGAKLNLVVSKGRKH